MTAELLQMPISVAARKGVSAVAAEASDRRVVLTSLGRPVAVVDSAARIDEQARALREGARQIIETYATAALDGAATMSLTELCARLGLDEAAVRSRARAYAAGTEAGAGTGDHA